MRSAQPGQKIMGNVRNSRYYGVYGEVVKALDDKGYLTIKFDGESYNLMVPASEVDIVLSRVHNSLLDSMVS